MTEPERCTECGGPRPCACRPWDLRMRRARYDGPVPERRDALGWASFEPGDGHPPGDEEIWQFTTDAGDFWSCARYDLVFLDEEEPAR
jgi:hypothetical protein